MIELETIAQHIDHADIPEDVFGLLLPGSDPAKLVTTTYHHIISVIHPDKFNTQPALLAIAQAAFTKLTRLRLEAEAKIKAGTYGNRKVVAAPTPVPHAPVVVSVKKRKFVVRDLLRQGDICDLYDCIEEGVHKPPLIFKVAQHPTDNDLVENESRVLNMIYPTTVKEEKFYRYLPRLVESFMLKGAKSSRRVNILKQSKLRHSLTEVMMAYPRGLDYRDAVWMFKRTLEVLGWLHSEKSVVHGAVIPSHVMINPENHGAKLIDWCYAVTDKKQHVRAMSVTWKACYAPEILLKQPVTPAADIYMAAACMVRLLGGTVVSPASIALPDTVPVQLKRFLAGCMATLPSRRPQDAWALHDELDELLLKLVGKPAFRKFEMPARTSTQSP